MCGLVFTAILSILAYLPARLTAPANICIPFALIFRGNGQSKLAVAATIILSVLLVLLLMGLLVIGFDTAMLKRKLPFPPVIGIPPDESDVSEQKSRPDRKLIFYGLPLFLQHVYQVSMITNLDSHFAEFFDWGVRRH